MATTAELLAAIDTQILALVNDPQVDYKIGDKTVSAGQKMKQLLEARRQIAEQQDADLSILAFDIDINEFGEDNSQVIS
jgi:hypothetical protein